MSMSFKIAMNLNAIERLKKMKGGRVRTGWERESDVLHAIINEIGAHLNGGQPFFIDGNGDLHFLRKDSPLGQKALKSQSRGTRHLPQNPNRRHYKAKEGMIAGLGVTKPCDIPPRPFMAETVRLHLAEWKEYYKTLAMAVAAGQMTEQQLMDALGERIKADLKMTISEGNFKPNSPLTAKAKGKNTPLIWTGDMQDHVAHEVIMGAAK